MNRILTALSIVAFIAFGLSATPAAAADAPLTMRILSSHADRVTGGDALFAVDFSSSVDPARIVVRLNGTPVTGSFQTDPGNPSRLLGEVTGFPEGRSVISAWAAGLSSAANLAVFNSPVTGPVFSGPHQQPFYCNTQALGLSAPTDANCSAPTQVSYRYRKTGGGFGTLTSPTERPADLAQTTTRNGQTVDYVVRVETGVINRGVYQWTVLAADGVTGNGWNGRFFYKYGGGCSAGHQQGQSVPNTLDDDELSRGYAIMTSSLNVLNTSCNDVLSAESTSMVKEHVIESLGKAPVWTVGEGGSGGSIQIQMISQNYPGLLNGILPTASFPDNSAPDYPDCRLLNGYYLTPGGAALSNAQREAVSGLSDPNGCLGLGAGADVVNASQGCVTPLVPPSVIFDPVTNPGGVRCTIWDNMINIYGTDPATGFARRTYNNAGVQYGLKALQSGSITPAQFIDLNEAIGGFDNNGALVPERSVGNDDGLNILYRTGRVNQGQSGYTDVPVIDARNYVDNEVNVHQFVNTYRMRERLIRFNGNYDNHVMFRAKGGPSVNSMQETALETMGIWLDGISADDSSRSLEEKVVAAKPSDAVDACWIAGVRTNGEASVGASNICETTYPPHSLPVNQAGKPLNSIVSKCRLVPVKATDYSGATGGQISQIQTIFNGGVCDWSQAGIGQQPVADTNISFGPEQVVNWRDRQINLRSSRWSVGRSRQGGTVTLTARLRPCPRVIWQRVTFERRVRQGNNWVWRSIGSPITTGSRCEARATVRNIRSTTRLRARAKWITGFRAALIGPVTIRVKGSQR